MSAVTIRDEECFLSRVLTMAFHNTANVTTVALQLGFVCCLRADILGTRRFGRWLCHEICATRGAEGRNLPMWVHWVKFNLHQEA